MNSGPAVIVKKGGFLSSVAHGLFGLLITVVICACLLGLYGLYLANGWFREALSAGESIVTALPQWRQAFPPALSDAVNDRRDPDYRESLDVDVSLAPSSGNERPMVVLSVHNRGDETVSLLSVRITLEDGRGAPIYAYNEYIATPIALGDTEDWNGPLLPHSQRKVAKSVRRSAEAEELEPRVEVTELRLWVPQSAPVVEPREASPARSVLPPLVSPAPLNSAQGTER